MINGNWYPISSAKKHNATLIVNDSGLYTVVLETEKTVFTGDWKAIKVSDRLGQTERKITFEDGSVFASGDNDSIDKLLAQHNQSAFNLWLHKRESFLLPILGMTIIILALGASSFKWGLPWASHHVARMLPQSTGEMIGTQTLAFLDKSLLETSNIDTKKQEIIKKRFATHLQTLNLDPKITYKIHFRKMGIANAFALPSGDIILTDKFINLSKKADEIDAVLLHEMGHVVHRHGLESVTQNSLMTVMVMLVLGNPDFVSELATGLGTTMVASYYSRKYETEADTFAFKNMLHANIDPKAFITIMTRLEKNTGMQDPAKSESTIDFFSSHPHTKNRIDIAQVYHECFKQNKTSCSISK